MRYVILEDIETGNKINTYTDWGLILGNKEISLPTPKTIYVDIAGADGSLDLTEAVTGETKYEDRTLKLPFTLQNKFMDLPSKVSEIANSIHGKRFKIFVYDDLDFYYIGRVSINEFKTSQATGTITLEAICDAYKYKKNITTYTYEISGSKTILVANLRKRVIPVIKIDSEMNIVFKGDSYAMSAGTYELLNICFEQGEYELTVKGNGNFTISYQEGGL